MASPWKRCCCFLVLLLLHLQTSACLHHQPADSAAESPVLDEGSNERMKMEQQFSQKQSSDASQRKLLQIQGAAVPFPPLKVLSDGEPCVLFQARRLSLRYDKQKQLDLTERAFSPQKTVDTSQSVCSEDKATLVMRFGDVEDLRGLTIRLQLSNTLYESSGQWWFSVDSVSLLYNTSEEAVFNASDVYAPASASYRCLHVSSLQRYSALLLPSSNHARRWAITFTDFQIQAFSVSSGKFSPASDCITFLTPAILMGLITSLILLLVLAYALHMVIHLLTVTGSGDPVQPRCLPPATGSFMFSHLPASLSLFPRLLLSSSPRTLTGACRLLGRMEAAVVRCLPGEPKLTISFCLDGSHKNMLRDQDEAVGKVLARISNSIAKSQGKAKKSKKNRGQQPGEAAEPAVVKLFYGEDEVPDTALNSEAWREGSVLQVGDVRYSVQRNAPTFTTAELPVSLLAGFPVCPKLEVEFGNLQDCEFTWLKENIPDSRPEAGQDVGWTEVGRDRVHVPSNQDIGCRFKLTCTPKDGSRSGPVKELVSVGAVEAGPGVCTFDNRHAYTVRGAEWPAIRVVSYNILADVYAQTDLSKTVLYPYCAPYALQLDYRQNLIKKELAGYNADIICLQEVDKGVFMDSLVPALDAFGLDGVFRIKEKQHEGLATFYRRSKFQLLSRHDIMLSEALTSDPVHSDLLEKLSANSVLKDKILQRSTSLQVSVLEDVSKPGRKVCVANTHLYWHPKGGNVRLVQMGVTLQHLRRVISDVAPEAPLLFCGDFNSTPNSGVFQLLSEAVVPQHHADWSSSGPEEACSMELLSAFPPLLSACGQPAYTNYVGGFHGCLDYIFIQSESMQVEQVIPLPSHQEVTTYEALPSVAHPSDHIALVCDLRWNL